MSKEFDPASSSDEPRTSFGEPLQVSVSRGTERFQSIQRTLSKPLTLDAEEMAEGNSFDLASWLVGRQEQQGPPFAKRVGLLFDNLCVYGDKVQERHINTVATPFWKLLKAIPRVFKFSTLFQSANQHKLLLNNMMGMVEDGEMLLVLGRPGAGCSTLLRVLGNRRKGYYSIDGIVSYGGLTPKEVDRAYRGEVAYCSEEDYHHPTLTVRQTLEFAIECKMPSQRMLNDRAGYKQELLNALLEIFGLRGCADTIVGNAFLRGVSGGERKRVSIAEQVASGASVDIWDGSTRGLDSSSALDYVRSLRITTDVLRKSTVVSIYQASENIYELFDKVMVVDEGKQLYFGPASEAVAYFERLGIQKPLRQTTADFLTGVTQLHERRVIPGFEDQVPKTAEDFERAWFASKHCQKLRQQLSAFEEQIKQDGRSHEIRTFVNSAKMGSNTVISRRTPYSTTILHQLRCLLRRELGMLWGDRYNLLFKLIYYVVFAIAGATMFLQLPETSSGALSRSGALFYALLFTILTEEAQATMAFAGRKVDAKHKDMALHHPAVLSLAQTVVEIPIAVIFATVFSIIYYFTAGLAHSAGQFFAFTLFLVVSVLCMATFFRLVGTVARSIDAAHMLAGCLIVMLMLHVGFLIPLSSMKPYFKWIRYINPLAYGWAALMANEFRNLKLKCTDDSLVPSGPGFDLAHQVCTLQGARPGQPYVLGSDYISAAYQIYVKDQWKYFVALFCFWILFVILRAAACEFIQFSSKGFVVPVSKRRKPSVDSCIAANSTESVEAPCDLNKPISDEQIVSGTTFTWKDIDYTVPVKGGHRQLLNKVSGFVAPGMTALMGSSGAGKTTLLDSLSQRKTIGRLEGEMLLNGMPQPRSFRRITGYAEQLDVHASLVTVRELLRFSAYLRQPASVSDSEKNAYVERVIYLLEMSDIADCLIGDPDSGEGISLEERKRLTIGVELVSRPKILFLDEPTSGLDAQASFKIVQFLRRLAAEGQTILCTIHQPSALLFEQFDRLLLLVRGGHTVYHGPIGEDAQTLIKYFENNGAPKCPPTANPAEYILDVVGKVDSAVDWPQIWNESAERQSVLSEISRINDLKHQAGSGHGEAGDDKVFARSYLYQIKLVTQRMLLMQWRNLEYQTSRVFMQVFSGLFIGFAFFSLDSTIADTYNRMYAGFTAVVVGAIIIYQASPEYLRQRLLYSRETSTSQYGWQAFATAIIFTEWPFTIVANTLFFLCFYWTVGLSGMSDRVGFFYLLHIVHALFSQTLGQAIASFVPNDFVASTVAPIATTSLVLGSGVMASYVDMPNGWHWLYYLSEYHMYTEAMLTNELHDKQVQCAGSEFSVFVPPANYTCWEYAGSWLTQAGGYLGNPNATDSCKVCQFAYGDEFSRVFSWSFGNRWRNLGIIIAFTVANILFIMAMARIYKVNKR
ncbi:ATP-binding cassette transporter snq2 [Coemansia sp. RSA 1290]|nr:ATP-binding cassette transporter snq2 [Coemansia sp. RSA 1290]KAJ2653045.1 ATP-binding cassette transporter snq2 [Coemansia sp. RSA 1250]